MKLKDWLKNRLFHRQLAGLLPALENRPVFPDELRLEPNQRCLILAPHPDDEVLGCGGLLLAYPDQCDVVCLTDGHLGGEVKLRRTEFEAAMKLAGVTSYQMLDIPEDMLLENAHQVQAAIEIQKYDYIFMPNPWELHSDHRAVLTLVKLLLKQHQKIGLQIAFYEIWSTLPLFNTYIDLSQLHEKKAALIDCYASQLTTLDYKTKILALNTYRGLNKNITSCEAYSLSSVSFFLAHW